MTGDLLAQLRQLSLTVERHSRSELEPLGLNSAQALVLAWLLDQRGGPACASQLHRQWGLSRAAISATLKNLQQAGYLEVALCPGDERKKQIVPTRKARDLQAQIEAGACREQARMCAGLSRRQLRDFEECLERMLQNLGALPRCADGPAGPTTRRRPT